MELRVGRCLFFLKLSDAKDDNGLGESLTGMWSLSVGVGIFVAGVQKR